MTTQNLNLARKWRSKNFDQIIGQDLCIRILKNGLYLNSFFPVYLFSGQRGCGKTTTARVFAAAINCEQLENFQKDPKIIVPCLECNSCKSINLGKHPDFIEIDAASHTGVDNVRNIIDASSLLPLIGRKKIYLIDEAHMLSKAAFNAFLKILEEPPASVLFILATTDVQKIIETVRSRSFQLFFTSIAQDILIRHLEDICTKESIKYDIEGIKLIIRESEGSARDAINLLEQVRFSNSCVNKSSVLEALGHISDDHLLMIFEQLVVKKNVHEFLTLLDNINYYSYSADFIWNRLITLFRESIRIKYEVNSKILLDYHDELKKIVSKCSLSNIIFALDEFCKNELIFLKSINKNVFLEILCLKIIDSNFSNNETKLNNFINNNDSINKFQNKSEAKTTIIHGTKLELIQNKDNLWDAFISEVKNLKDPLLNSIFSQANFVKFDQSSGAVTISFFKKNIFFKDLINDSSSSWTPILKQKFNVNAFLEILFEEKANPENNLQKINDENVKIEKKINLTESDNFNDKDKWKATNLLLKYFPGTITEIVGNTNE